jgi:histidinol-phosphate phosphatase family protein
MKNIVFLDRDGVINKYPGNYKYVTSQAEFEFLPGAKEAIKRLNEVGYKLFIISNQAGVTKGLYTKVTLDSITKNMLKEIGIAGGSLEKVLYCTHTEEDNCNCRKPKIGLIKQAISGLKGIDLNKTFFVGDSIRDVKTGKIAGCKTILVLCGRESIENKPNWEIQPDFIADNLYEAVEIILSQK